MNHDLKTLILRVAVAVPLRQCFDYSVPAHIDPLCLQPGLRVMVSFGRKKMIGMIDEITDNSDIDAARLKPILEVLDQQPVLDETLRWLCQWASQYYFHPLGEVYSAALPVKFRTRTSMKFSQSASWRLTEAGHQCSPSRRAFRQAALLQQLKDAREGIAESRLDEHSPHWKSTMRVLEQKGWVEKIVQQEAVASKVQATENLPGYEMNAAQQQAVQTIRTGSNNFNVFLLHGVTGSGKTEVYLQVIATLLKQQRQVLVLVPEIGLTPQLIQRFEQRFNVPVVTFHSGLNDNERAQNWLRVKNDKAKIVIGTRSAIFAVMPSLGLIVVDEEHDLSFKQQEGFRYSARDMAIVRARQENIPVILGSATPSMESLANAGAGRYQLLRLPNRAGTAKPPVMRLIDLKQRRLDEGLSEPLIQSIHEHVENGGQVLLFLNRRGYAPTLLCHDCGWVCHCLRCDAHMTLHHRSRKLRCHHCNSERELVTHCPDCGSADLHAIGQGTERTESALKRHFPNTRIARIDRDTTRRKGAMESVLKSAQSGEQQILLGTQLLAKGHHFPRLTLVAILDSDQGLFSADFRSAERMAQLILQVAGRAGRGERNGEVLIQTHHPEHELMQAVVKQDYAQMTETLLAERKLLHWPPYSYLAMIRAESPQQALPLEFLLLLSQKTRQAPGCQVKLLGPVPAPMEKRAGRFRAHLLLQADDRAQLHQQLSACVEMIGSMPEARQVRWSVDVDPQEMF